MKFFPGMLIRDRLVRILASIGGVTALLICALTCGDQPLGPGREEDTNALILGVGLLGAVLGGLVALLFRRLATARSQKEMPDTECDD